LLRPLPRESTSCRWSEERHVHPSGHKHRGAPDSARGKRHDDRWEVANARPPTPVQDGVEGRPTGFGEQLITSDTGQEAAPRAARACDWKKEVEIPRPVDLAGGAKQLRGRRTDKAELLVELDLCPLFADSGLIDHQLLPSILASERESREAHGHRNGEGKLLSPGKVGGEHQYH
jgi:hypothetical protein